MGGTVGERVGGTERCKEGRRGGGTRAKAGNQLV